MYAVIRTGGKQYRVELGDVIEVEHLPLKGKKASFTPLMVRTDDGETIVDRKELKSQKVEAKVIGDGKGGKVDVKKYRPKSGFQTRRGHRQLYSLIEISAIGDHKAPAKKAAKKAETGKEGEPEADAAAKEAEEAPKQVADKPKAKSKEKSSKTKSKSSAKSKSPSEAKPKSKAKASKSKSKTKSKSTKKKP